METIRLTKDQLYGSTFFDGRSPGYIYNEKDADELWREVKNLEFRAVTKDDADNDKWIWLCSELDLYPQICNIKRILTTEDHFSICLRGDYIDTSDALKAIAKERDLEYIDTTSDENGFPRGMGCALIGFNNFEDAENIAKEYGFRIESYFQHSGWRLWCCHNHWVDEPFELEAKDCGADEAYHNSDEVWECNKGMLNIDNYDDPEEFFAFSSAVEKLYEMAKSLKDDEIVVCDHGCDSPEVYKQHVMEFSCNGKNFIIGVTPEHNIEP